ncbi:MAG: helix-turn-helix transcriptional regulator [Clostridia bacterium]|nr:helix-turn-helix transcriptional regulator [Clostridia bacterium]
MSKLQAFRETEEVKRKEFNKKAWYFSRSYNNGDSTVPPHYAETIEFNIYKGHLGEVHISGHPYTLSGYQVYLIAPNAVHAMNYKKNDGMSAALKIDPEHLKSILDLTALLSHHNMAYDDLPVLIDLSGDEAAMMNELLDLLDGTDKITDALVAITRFFELFIAHADTSQGKTSLSHNDELRSILSWTEQNYMRKVTLEEVASIFGYNKHYFCNKFKNTTGVTYITYLNNIRINHAKDLLRAGVPVNQVCYECGFDDASYFIQIFKKFTDTTPKKYLNLHAKHKS